MYLSKAKENEFEEYYKMKCEDFNLYWTAGNYEKPLKNNLYDFYIKCIKANSSNEIRKEIYFIRTDDNAYAGYLYLDINGEILDIPVAVKKDFTGQGLAKKAVIQGLEMARKMGFKKTVGKIREDNLSSMRLYERCGYTITEDFIEIYSSELNKNIKMYTVYKNLD